jgi:hypothetical protein
VEGRDLDGAVVRRRRGTRNVIGKRPVVADASRRAQVASPPEMRVTICPARPSSALTSGTSCSSSLKKRRSLCASTSRAGSAGNASTMRRHSSSRRDASTIRSGGSPALAGCLTV